MELWLMMPTVTRGLSYLKPTLSWLLATLQASRSYYTSVVTEQSILVALANSKARPIFCDLRRRMERTKDSRDVKHTIIIRCHHLPNSLLMYPTLTKKR